MRNNRSLNTLLFAFNQQWHLYKRAEESNLMLKPSARKSHDQLASVLCAKGFSFVAEAALVVEYAKDYRRVSKILSTIINNKRSKMKHFSIEDLKALTMPETRAELDELVEQLFEDYKHVSARIHLAEAVAEGDAELKKALGVKALEAANAANAMGATWRTDLPTVEEAFNPEADNNQAKPAPAPEATAEVAQPAAELTAKEVEDDNVGATGITNDGTLVTGLKIGEEKDGMIMIAEGDKEYWVKKENIMLKGENETALRKRIAKQGSLDKAPAADSKPASEGKKKARLSDETVEQIRAKLTAGGKQSEIAKEYGIDPSTVSDIKCNRGRYAKKEEAAVTPAPVTDQPAS